MTPPLNDITSPTGQRVTTARPAFVTPAAWATLAVGTRVRIMRGGHRNELGTVTGPARVWLGREGAAVTLDTLMPFVCDVQALEKVTK